MIDSQEGEFESVQNEGDVLSKNSTFERLLKFKNGLIEKSSHSNDPNTLSPSSSSIREEEEFTPEYSPLPLKHQQYYQQNIKLQNRNQYDGEITYILIHHFNSQRTFNSRPSQPTGNFSIQYTTNNQYDEQQSMSGIVLSEESRTCRTYKTNPPQQNYYRLRCQELDKEMVIQREKFKAQQKFQQSIVEKLEETSYNIETLVQKNNQLTRQLKSTENELIVERSQTLAQKEQIFCQTQHLEHVNQEIAMLRHQLADSELANRLKCRQVVQLQGIIGNQSDKQIKQHQKFCECILEMVKMCNPPQDKELTLKQAWKWLKQVLDDYMLLKKNQTGEPLRQTQSMASSTFRTSTNEKRYSSSQMMNVRQSDATIQRSKSRDKMAQSEANYHNIQVSQLIKSNRPLQGQEQQLWKYNNYETKDGKENRL